MARLTKPLSDAEVRKAKPKEKMYKLFDGNGLTLEIKPNGRKIWRIAYTFQKKRKTYTLGDYPAVTISAARLAVQQVKQQINEGIDPVQERQASLVKPEPKDIITFKDVAEKFLEFKLTTYSASHYNRQVRRLEIYVYPFIGSIEIDTITKQDIIDTLERIPTIDVKSTKDTNRHETIKRVYGLISQIYDFGLTRDLVKDHIPKRLDQKSILPNPEAIKFNAVTDLKSIKEIYKIIVTNYPGNIVTSLALQFQALTALRPGNIRNMKWEYVDFQNDVVNFPGEAMKTKEPFRLPLIPTLTYIIDQMKPITRYTSEYVFCSPIAPSRMLSNNTLNMAIKIRYTRSYFSWVEIFFFYYLL
jgi:integrase